MNYSDKLLPHIHLIRDIFSCLQNGGGIQQMLITAYEYLQNPMTICDTSFSILYNYPAHENPLDFKLQNEKQYMRTESVHSMHNERIVEQIFAETAPFVSFRKELNIHMMYSSIRIRHSVVGYVCILGKNRSFNEVDYEFVDILTQMISVEMQKNSFFTEKTGLKYEYFLIDLIEGSINDHTLILQRYTQLGRTPLAYFHILIAAAGSSQPILVNHHYFTEQILTILPNSMIFFYKGNLIILRSQNTPVPFTGKEYQKLSNFLLLNQMLITVSHAYQSLSDTPIYYRQSLHLLETALKYPFEQQILDCCQYQLETLLHTRHTPKEIEAAIHPDIHILIAHDNTHHTEYLYTLRTYLEQDRNALKAAEKLHIHKSTFFYRLNKISDLLDLKLTDCRRLFSYELSLRLLLLFLP